MWCEVSRVGDFVVVFYKSSVVLIFLTFLILDTANLFFLLFLDVLDKSDF